MRMADEDFYKATTFEEKIKMLYPKMTEKQKRENIEQVEFTCKDYCGKCPSYVGTGEKSLAFCMEGKSSIITEKKGCLCEKCPISKTMSLRCSNYCVNGDALGISLSEK